MGTIIKSGGVARIEKSLEAFVLKDHMAEAQSVVREARLRAQQLIEAANTEINNDRRDAEERGFAEGYAKGLAQGQSSGHEEAYNAAKSEFTKEQEQLVSTLRAMVASIDEQKNELIEQARRDVLVLAVAVAEKITKRTARLDRQAADANARKAIEKVAMNDEVVLQVNPLDLEAMRRYAESLAEGLSNKRHLKVVGAREVEPGGCVVESLKTRVDATINRQFQEAAKLILGDEYDTWENLEMDDDESEHA